MNDNDNNDNDTLTDSPVTFRLTVKVDLGDGEGEHEIDLMESQSLSYDVMLEVRAAAMHGDLDVHGCRTDALTFGALVATTYYAESDAATV